MEILVLGFGAFLASYSGVSLIHQLATRRGIVDVPTARSSHQVVTPRGGGLAIVVITLVGSSIALITGSTSTNLSGYLVGGLLVAITGATDDIYHLSAKMRLVIQSVAALILVWGVGTLDRISVPILGMLELGIFAGPLTWFWVLSLTNAYNFMDGIDGIAAGQAIVAGIFWLIVSLFHNERALIILSILIVGSSLGFLLHNLPPARIFMGDVSSTFLGFTFAALPVLLYRTTTDPQIAVLGVFFLAPFIFDTGITILRRAWQRENLLQAHRTHLYQRWIRLGYSHGRVSLLYSSFALICGLLGLITLWYPTWAWLGWLGAIGILLGNLGLVTQIERASKI